MKDAWSDAPVVVAANGPSLRRADLDSARPWARVVVVNDAHRLAPWATALYAGDRAWWRAHPEALAFAGERWTGAEGVAPRGLVRRIPILTGRAGFCFTGKAVHAGAPHGGGNSGFQAINLAIARGARAIILMGFDMGVGPDGARHWFDDPSPPPAAPAYALWAKTLDAAAPGARAAGIEIINCSRESALGAYPRLALVDALEALR